MKGSKSFKTPEEIELTEALKQLAIKPELPRFAEVEPGALLYLVKLAWSQSQGRDGRKGHLSEQEIADRISHEIGRPFSRNQYQAMFGDVRRAALGPSAEPRRQRIPRDVAYAYLKTALYNWSIDHAASKRQGREKIGIPIYLGQELDLDQVVLNACEAMFSTLAEHSDGQEFLIRCRPSPGAGIKGFYEDCGRQGHSIIYATQREPVKMTEPSRQILEWEALCQALFGFSNRDKPIHIWAVREPLISRDSRQTGALYGIGFFQTILMMAKSLSVLNGGSEPSLWQAIVERGVVAVKKHPDNDRFRQGHPPVEAVAERPSTSIIEDMIFPSAVPDRWRSRNATLRTDHLDLLVAIGTDQRVEYNLFARSEIYETPPVVHYPSPSGDSDESFVFLYKACRAFLCNKNTRLNDVNHEYLGKAEYDGWYFFDVNTFAHVEFPIPYKKMETRLRGKQSKTGE